MAQGLGALASLPEDSNFGSLHLHQMTHNCLCLQLQGDLRPLPFIGTDTYMCTHTIKDKILKKKIHMISSAK